MNVNLMNVINSIKQENNSIKNVFMYKGKSG